MTTLSQHSPAQSLLLEGGILSALMRLSVPSMMYGVVQAVCPLIDSFFINNFIGTAAGSAVSYSSSVLYLINAAALGAGVAGGAIIGQANGRGDKAAADKTALQMFVLVLAMSVVFMPVLFGLALFLKTAVSAQIASDVFAYLSLNCLVIPMTFLEAAYNAVKNACGETHKPFIRMSMMLILKLVFNMIFICKLQGGIRGAVAATFLANVIILLWMVHELFLQKSGSNYSWKGFKNDRRLICKLLRIGAPSMLSNLILNLGFMLITVEIEKYGTTVLNGQGIANNILLMGYTVPQAFSTGTVTLVSMSVGSGRIERAKKACKTANAAAVLTASLIGLVIFLAADTLAGIFTSVEGVRKIIVEYLHVCTFSLPFFGILMVNIGAFNGLGKTSVALLIGILRVWVFRYFFMLVTEDLLGVRSVFLGDLFSNLICAAVTIAIALRINWQSRI